MENYNNKKIIMIHGLASKPPKKDTHKLWKKTLIENIKVFDRGVAEKIENSNELFESAYWANAVPNHIEDDAEYVTSLEKQINLVIAERQKIKDKFNVKFGKKVSAFFIDKGLDLVELLGGALTIKDDVMKAVLRETELYSEDQYIADKIRQPLEDAISKAWKENKEVIIISHSMGTFISYDVLWRFSHRSEEKYRKYRDKKVKMLVTMGSPLGNKTVKDLLFAKHHDDNKDNEERRYPTNIEYWHNYSCLGDIVAHDTTLEDDFFREMRRLELLERNVGRTIKYSIDYINMYNPFKGVPDKKKKNKSKPNPHKSYGYLVQPRLASWVSDFLEGDLN